MISLRNFIFEAKEKIEVGGITFREGDKVIYLKTYTDENNEEWEEEITGTITNILPSKKILIKLANDYNATIHANDLVGLYVKPKSYLFKTSYNTETKYQDELDDINYQIDDIVNQINQLNNDMEEQIIDDARQAWLSDNPTKRASDFNPHSAEGDKYMDKAGSEWAETSGLNYLEKELEKLNIKRDKAERKLKDYIGKNGKNVSKEGKIKYINKYTPIE